MRITRIWADDAGTSHFEDVDVDLEPAEYAPPAPPLELSPPIPAERALFFEAPVGWFGDWHPSPRRQLYVNLSGRLEVEVGDGEVREFGPGEVVLVEDLIGPGHVTRVVGDDRSTGVFIHLTSDER